MAEQKKSCKIRCRHHQHNSSVNLYLYPPCLLLVYYYGVFTRACLCDCVLIFLCYILYYNFNFNLRNFSLKFHANERTNIHPHIHTSQSVNRIAAARSSTTSLFFIIRLFSCCNHKRCFSK